MVRILVEFRGKEQAMRRRLAAELRLDKRLYRFLVRSDGHFR
uniref:Uncharacterized protein n=1 Tax=Romanomermis culicivorax TaxID=13658 RepID=A0A915I3S8_ROMCU